MLAAAKRADADTFHACNASPQMQKFNGGLWLTLENYILDHANTDNMHVTVITGPVFAESDPVIHGIKIPIEFWKVTAFVHDRTADLTVVAYTASQAKYLPRIAKPAFVFGDFAHLQVPVARVEALTGLDFGHLRTRDPLAGADTSFASSLGTVNDLMLE